MSTPTLADIQRCKSCRGQVLPRGDGTAACLQCGREPLRVTPLPIESTAELGGAVLVKLASIATAIADAFEAVDDLRHEAARFVTIAGTCGVQIPEHVALVIGRVPDYMVAPARQRELAQLRKCGACGRACRGDAGLLRHERTCPGGAT